ncbi:MAG TPA: alginate lyase family protein [archaeon]|nr:alginate lyase family protein [archaeon]
MRSISLAAFFFCNFCFLAVETHANPSSPEQLELVFSRLDYVHEKIRESKKLYQQGNTKEAVKTLLDYYRNRENVTWHFNRKDKKRLVEDYKKLFSSRMGIDQSMPNQTLITYHPTEHADSILAGEWYWYRKFWSCGFPPRWDEIKEDAEYNEQLNRHNFLFDLGLAYWLTGEEKYARGAITILSDFIDKNKAPTDGKVHWDYLAWGNLQAGIRARIWPSAWEFLIDSPAFSGDFFIRLLFSIVQHKDYLRAVAPKSEFGILADHNHYIMEMEGLFNLAVMFPEFKTSAGDRDFAIMELDRCRRNQILEDGGHIEETPGYHAGCIWWFAAPMVLGELNGVSFNPDYREGLKKMFYFLSHITRPNLTIAPFGDSDPNMVTETFSLGELLFSEPVTAQSGALSPSVFWLKSGAALETRETAADFPLLEEFPIGGFYCMRSSWRPEALYLAMRNGKRQRKGGGGGHVHADHLSIDVTAYGDPLIIDPGIYTYTEGPWRKYFKITESHNTIAVDGKSSMEYQGTWKWDKDPDVKNGSFQTDKNGITIQASHDGFQPAICTRKITFIQDRFWLIDDQVTGLNGNRVSYSYHFSPNMARLLDGAFQGAQTEVSSDNASVAVIQIAGKAGAVLEDGWYSEIYLTKAPIKVLRLVEENAIETSRSVCLIIPFPPGEPQDYSLIVEGSRVKVIIRGSHPYKGELDIG